MLGMPITLFLRVIGIYIHNLSCHISNFFKRFDAVSTLFLQPFLAYFLIETGEREDRFSSFENAKETDASMIGGDRVLSVH